MRKFDYSKLVKQNWDSETLSYVSKIYEYKGKQELYIKNKAVELYRLSKTAALQSVESSNEIEGIVTNKSRYKKLIDNEVTPINIDEEEILGYSNAFSIVNENYDYVPVKSSYILQLHKEMLKLTTLSFAGKYKTTQNAIVEVNANGDKKLLFKPLDPFETPEAIEKICESYNREIELGNVEPLLLIPNFILDFLCIHPFNDGNGRMSRILTLLLLYKSGFMVGKYISLDKEIAKYTDLYYGVLYKSDKNWHDETNKPIYFTKYILSIILKCYRDLDDRLTVSDKAGNNGNAYDVVKTYISTTIGKFTKNDVLIACPSLRSSSIEAALKALVEDKTIARFGASRSTYYVKNL